VVVGLKLELVAKFVVGCY